MEKLGVSETASDNKHMHKAALEALLFVAGESVPVSSLVKATEMSESEIKRLMEELISDYKDKNSGILIVEVADGYQMVTNPDFSMWVKKFKKYKSVE